MTTTGSLTALRSLFRCILVLAALAVAVGVLRGQGQPLPSGPVPIGQPFTTPNGYQVTIFKSDSTVPFICLVDARFCGNRPVKPRPGLRIFVFDPSNRGADAYAVALRCRDSAGTVLSRSQISTAEPYTSTVLFFAVGPDAAPLSISIRPVLWASVPESGG